jgi:uroporphyrinogen decarboxylase
MDKRERLERTIAGEATDRAPVALWRPFPGDDQRTADYAAAAIDFQLRYDWDLCLVVPPWSFAGADFGLQDEWEGAPDGSRTPIRRPIRRSLDWTDLRPPDPTRGEYGRLAAVIKSVCDGLTAAGVPVALGVLSPLAQAARLTGFDMLKRHLRTRPDRLLTGLTTLTESTLRFLDSLRSCAISGLAVLVEHADFNLLSEQEYETFGLPGDAAVLAGVPKTAWLKMAYFAGSAPMARMFGRISANVIAWDDRVAEPDLQAGRGIVSGAICGGLDSEKHLRAGTPTSVRDAVRDALLVSGNRKLLVGCGRPLSVTVPHSNLRAARTAVERMSVS